MKISFFAANRQRIATVLDGGLIVIPGCADTQRGNDAAHAYEQEANSWF